MLPSNNSTDLISPDPKVTKSIDTTFSGDSPVKQGINSPSSMLQFFADSINSKSKSTSKSSDQTKSGNPTYGKIKVASADSIPYPLKKLDNYKEDGENSDNLSENQNTSNTKTKSASFGTIPVPTSPTTEKKRHKPSVSPLNLAPPGKITNPSQFSYLKSDSSRGDVDSISDEKSDSSSKNSLRSEDTELEKFLEFKKQNDVDSGKKPGNQDLGKFTTFSMKDVRSYLKTKN